MLRWKLDFCFKFFKFLCLIFLPGSPFVQDPFCFFFVSQYFFLLFSSNGIRSGIIVIICKTLTFYMHLLIQQTLHTQNSKSIDWTMKRRKNPIFFVQFYCFHSRLATTYYNSAHSILVSCLLFFCVQYYIERAKEKWIFLHFFSFSTIAYHIQSQFSVRRAFKRTFGMFGISSTTVSLNTCNTV